MRAIESAFFDSLEDAKDWSRDVIERWFKAKAQPWEMFLLGQLTYIYYDDPVFGTAYDMVNGNSRLDAIFEMMRKGLGDARPTE